MARADIYFWIIDDDLSFGKSLKRMLNARGIAAELFGSAQSFLDSVSPEKPGCAIVDIHMPGCDGFNLMKKMCDLSYTMSVIIVTGQASSDARDRAMQSGALGYLQKPFSAESLLELVDKQDLDQSAC
jgi:two-component system, LuxR family, response regulator FixJ